MDSIYVNNNRDIDINIKKSLMVKRYFCKRGLYIKSFNWLILYKALLDFKLIFKFKYSLITKVITADYVPHYARWFNKMRFFQFYLKLFKRFKWQQFPIKKIFFFVNKAKRNCYSSLIKSKKK